MNGFPIQIFFFLGLAFLGVGWVAYQRFIGVKRVEEGQSRFRLGELAQRLRLSIVQGDPQFNLFIRQANVDVMRGPADGRPIHIEARAEGAPDGLPTELRYLYRVEQKTDSHLLGQSIKWTTWFDCRLSVRARQPFPPFEVVSRRSPIGAITRTQALPECPTGDPAADATYLVTTNEPGMARALGPHLARFATFEKNAGVHLLGDGQAVSYVLRHDGAPILANVLYYPEEASAALHAIARTVGG